MKVEKFEDLTFWKESIDLSTEVFKILEGNKDLSFKNQFTQASVAISANIVQ
jgi:four helix bundle protein